MSQDTVIRKILHVHTAPCFQAVWSESWLTPSRWSESLAIHRTQSKDWSGCMANLSCRWAHMQSCWKCCVPTLLIEQKIKLNTIFVYLYLLHGLYQNKKRVLGRKKANISQLSLLICPSKQIIHDLTSVSRVIVLIWPSRLNWLLTVCRQVSLHSPSNNSLALGRLCMMWWGQINSTQKYASQRKCFYHDRAQLCSSHRKCSSLWHSSACVHRQTFPMIQINSESIIWNAFPVIQMNSVSVKGNIFPMTQLMNMPVKGIALPNGTDEQCSSQSKYIWHSSVYSHRK